MSELSRSARALTSHWWPASLTIPLGAAAGTGHCLLTHPSYAANSYIVMVPQGPRESTTAVSHTQPYGRLAGQPQVLAGAAAQLGRSTAGLVRGTTSPDAPVIEITGTGSRGADAVRAADA
ncbi:hypothetical protein, partial [Saccharothrix sp. ST-888]|uniref:hypothetical protein n=1 Tax=Saccharothrix sp. ST-888 TaxID=1427391 RepID=UPI0005EC8739